MGRACLPDEEGTAILAALYEPSESGLKGRRLIVLQDYKGPGNDSAPKSGAAKDQTKIGDTLYVLEGCSVPVVLRKKDELYAKDEREDKYELVGKCYLHGYMDGEGLKNADGMAKEERALTLVWSSVCASINGRNDFTK